MKSLVRHITLIAMLAAAAGLAGAQTNPAPGGPDASGPAVGMGMGVGMHAGAGMRGWHMKRDNTPGWSLMTPKERSEHYRTMMGMKTYDECHAYMVEEHARMAERAKQKGRPVPAQPRHDPCARLKG